MKYKSKINTTQKEFQPNMESQAPNVILPPVPKSAEEDISLRAETFKAMALAEYHKDMLKIGNPNEIDPNEGAFLTSIAQSEYTLKLAKINSWQNELEGKFRVVQDADVLTGSEKEYVRNRIINKVKDPIIIPTFKVEKEKEPEKEGTPVSLKTIETEVNQMQDIIEAVGSRWRSGPIWTNKKEAIETIQSRLPELGWQGRNVTQRTQLFSTLDRNLKGNKRVEWTDEESNQLAGMLGLVTSEKSIKDISLEKPESYIKSLPDEFQRVWEKAKKEGVSPENFVQELNK